MEIMPQDECVNQIDRLPDKVSKFQRRSLTNFDFLQLNSSNKDIHVRSKGNYITKLCSIIDNKSLNRLLRFVKRTRRILHANIEIDESKFHQNHLRQRLLRALFSNCKYLSKLELKTQNQHSLISLLLYGTRGSRKFENLKLKFIRFDAETFSLSKKLSLTRLNLSYERISADVLDRERDNNPKIQNRFPIIFKSFSKDLKELVINRIYHELGQLSRPFVDFNTNNGLANSLPFYPNLEILKIHLGEYLISNGTGLNTLFEACSGLEKLKVFHFKWVSSAITTKFRKILDMDVELIPKILMNNPDLKDISLDVEGGVYLSDEFMYGVAEALRDYHFDLRRLKLRFPKNISIGDESLCPLIEAVSVFEGLEELYLSFTGADYFPGNTKVSDKFLEALSKNLRFLKNLKSFNLHLHYAENLGQNHYTSVGLRWLLNGLVSVVETLKSCSLSLRMDFVSDEAMREMEEKLIALVKYGVLEVLKIGLRNKTWIPSEEIKGGNLKEFFVGEAFTKSYEKNLDS